MKRKLMSLFLIIVVTAAALAYSGKVLAVNPDDYICLPVVMYHSVRPDDCGKDSITPWEFENDLKYFKENDYQTVTMSDIISFSEGNSKLPEKPVLLSFDDGYYNNYKYVYPLLKKYDARIVMSVIVKATDKFTRKPSNNVSYAHMTWGQLNEMIGSGHVEVQNHSFDMHSYGKSRVGCGQKQGEPLEKYEEALSADLVASQTMIYEMTGKTPSTFTYPYGKYNDNTVEILRGLGFDASFSCEYGINLINKEGETDLFNLKRICRAHNQSAEKVIREAMKTLKYR